MAACQASSVYATQMLYLSWSTQASVSVDRHRARHRSYSKMRKLQESGGKKSSGQQCVCHGSGSINNQKLRTAPKPKLEEKGLIAVNDVHRASLDIRTSSPCSFHLVDDCSTRLYLCSALLDCTSAMYVYLGNERKLRLWSLISRVFLNLGVVGISL